MKRTAWTLGCALALGGLGLVLAAGQATGQGKDKIKDKVMMHLPSKGVCVLFPTKGSKVRGEVHLTQKDGYTHVTGEVSGLTPGLHGFHIHEFGDLCSDDGTSTGGHYNPEGKKHGAPDAEERHLGDLGNIKAGKNGVAKVDVKMKGLKVHFVIGRGIIVHADPDDFKTQPTGNAGGRVAFGVIGIANPGKMEHKKKKG